MYGQQIPPQAPRATFQFPPPPPHAVMSNVPTARPGVQPWIVALIVSVLVIGIVLVLVFVCWKPFAPGNEVAPRDTTPTGPQVAQAPTTPGSPAPWTSALQPFMTGDGDVNNYIMFAIKEKGMAPSDAQQWAIQRVHQKRLELQAQEAGPSAPPAAQPAAQLAPTAPTAPIAPTSPPSNGLIMPSQEALFPQPLSPQSEESGLPSGLTPLHFD